MSCVPRERQADGWLASEVLKLKKLRPSARRHMARGIRRRWRVGSGVMFLARWRCHSKLFSWRRESAMRVTRKKRTSGEARDARQKAASKKCKWTVTGASATKEIKSVHKELCLGFLRVPRSPRLEASLRHCF